MMMRSILITTGLWLIAFPAHSTPLNITSETAQYQSIDQLHELAMSALKQKVDQHVIEPQIQLHRLNRRIQLPRCQHTPEVHDKTADRLTGRMTLSVQCHQPKWQTFISAVVDGKLLVITATQGILKQAVIKPEDVQTQAVHYKKVPKDAIRSLNSALGMRVKKNISAHEVLTLRNLQPPFWVRKKQAIRIVTYIGGIEVEAKGIALQDGVEKQQIAIKNLNSGKTIKGIVIAPNTVWIP